MSGVDKAIEQKGNQRLSGAARRGLQTDTGSLSELVKVFKIRGLMIVIQFFEFIQNR